MVNVSGFNKLYENTNKNSVKEVMAISEQYVCLGFTSNTDYVDNAYHKLLSACKNGHISVISTQFSTSDSFMSWTNKMLMNGSCIEQI